MAMLLLRLKRLSPALTVSSKKRFGIRSNALFKDEDELLSIIGEAVQDNSVENVLVGGNLRSLLIDGDSPFLYRWYGHLLDFAHTSLGLPWWLTIAASIKKTNDVFILFVILPGAFGIRLLLFPFITLVNQRNYSLYHNAIPNLLKHHVQISQARVQLDLKQIFEEEGKLAQYSAEANLATTGSQLFNISIAIRMEQSVRVGGSKTVTAIFGRFAVGSLTVGSLFIFGSLPAAPLWFCVTDFTLNTVLAMLYGTKTYRNLFSIPHPIVLSNPSQEGYVDLPSQLAQGYESGMGKIRAIRRANIAALRSAGHGILLYDGDEIKEFFKKWLSKLIGIKGDKKT
ncbi:hypothetical protein D918_01846 [Trichuris suis]|nr:hypothetical protein D918_01846 [Trichuris suis]